MSSLRTVEHLPDCKSQKSNNVVIYVCVTDCPAMAAFLVPDGEVVGECDAQPAPANEAEAKVWADVVGKLLQAPRET